MTDQTETRYQRIAREQAERQTARAKRRAEFEKQQDRYNRANNRRHAMVRAFRRSCQENDSLDHDYSMNG